MFNVYNKLIIVLIKNMKNKFNYCQVILINRTRKSVDFQNFHDGPTGEGSPAVQGSDRPTVSATVCQIMQ